MHAVTALIHDWKSGDEGALEQLTELVYGELHRLASSYLRRERAGHTLQPTALLHEAYLRLCSQKELDFQNRSHFFGVAAHLMRLILVDHARGKNREKRGGGAARVPLDEAWNLAPDVRSRLMVQLDDGLRELAEFDQRKAQVIEMRFFGGMSVEETAEALGVGVATVGRDQRAAEAWLNRYLTHATAADD